MAGKIWVFDFDQTITIKHTFYLTMKYQDKDGATKEKYQDGRFLSDAEKSENLRNPEWLKKFIEARWAEKDKITIVTNHNNLGHVASYIGTLFNDNELKNLSDKEILPHDEGKYYLNNNKPISCASCCG